MRKAGQPPKKDPDPAPLLWFAHARWESWTEITFKYLERATLIGALAAMARNSLKTGLIAATVLLIVLLGMDLYSGVMEGGKRWASQRGRPSLGTVAGVLGILLSGALALWFIMQVVDLLTKVMPKP